MRFRLAALALLVPAAATGQLVTRPARAYVAQTVAVNPLGFPFGIASAEYEHTVGRSGLAVGVGGLSSFATGGGSVLDDGETYRTLQAKLKYYPREEGLRGFAIGVTAGVASARSIAFSSSSYDANGALVDYSAVYRTRTAPTLGVALDYNAFIGRRRRFLLGFGVGAKRTLGATQSGDALGRALFDPRLQVGFGF